MNVILPERMPVRTSTEGVSSDRGIYRTIYLLHGLSDDESAWIRQTSIERYVNAYQVAVVMPTVHRGYYINMKQGPAYWDFISGEIPRLAEHLFPLSSRREDRFAAGLSMGGYGAFKLAMRCPDQFAAAASLSGALDFSRFRKPVLSKFFQSGELDRLFGPDLTVLGTMDDPLAMAEEIAKTPGKCPRLYQCCGTSDMLYEDNVIFRDHAKRLGLPLQYEEDTDYEHNWIYWDMTIQRALKWLLG